MKMQISEDQLAQIVRGIETGMKGRGPAEYGMPSDVMEFYLYSHPMSMLEFYVDKAGVAGSGAGKAVKRKLIKFRDIVGSVAKKMGKSKQFQDALKKGGDKAKKVVEKKVSEKLQDLRKQVTTSMADKAETAGSGHCETAGSGHCGCGPEKKKKHSGHKKKMHGHGHQMMHGKGHGTHSIMEGGAFADGSDMGVTGVGLQLNQLGFVTTLPASAPLGSMAVPFTNHLRTHTGNAGPDPPAGSYGSSAMPIKGGAWGG
jgi:hypothetical protein